MSSASAELIPTRSLPDAREKREPRCALLPLVGEREAGKGRFSTQRAETATIATEESCDPVHVQAFPCMSLPDNAHGRACPVLPRGHYVPSIGHFMPRWRVCASRALAALVSAARGAGSLVILGSYRADWQATGRRPIAWPSLVSRGARADTWRSRPLVPASYATSDSAADGLPAWRLSASSPASDRCWRASTGAIPVQRRNARRNARVSE
jgi:hypothetical protein